MKRKTLLLSCLALILGLISNAQPLNGQTGPYWNGNYRLYSGLELYQSSPGSHPVLKGSDDMADLADSAYTGKYDTINLNFKLIQKTYYAYDSGGLLIQAVNQSMDKQGNWKNYSMDTLSYTGPYLKKAVTRQWDSQLGTWKNTFRYDYFYDAQNILQSTLISTWNSDSLKWQSAEQHSYTYQAQNLVSSDLLQLWNNALLSWDNNMQTIYTYDAQGIPTLVTVNQWLSGTQEWSPYSKSHYTNSNGHTTEMYTERYNTSQTTWYDVEKYIYTYTPEGKIETITLQDKDLILSAWVNSTLTANTYQNGNLVNVLIKAWQKHLNDWRNYQQKDTYFSQHEIFGIGERQSAPILLQNPVQAGNEVRTNLPFSVTGYTFDLYSLTGQLVGRQVAGSGNSYKVPDVTAGLYILKASARQHPVLVQRILIIR